MAAAQAESVLQKAAADGSLDVDEWPETLQYILDRLDVIVNDFPRPRAPPSHSVSSASERDSPLRAQPPASSQESQTADKENAPPATPPRPPVPAFPGSPAASQSDSHGFPAEIINSYSVIRNTLSQNFAKGPPHTIQRLAELILEPKRHYKFLPPYLRALDRVVSVSSPTTIFPLPQAILPTSGGLLNGTTSTPPSALGSDESLGGALLTPIPWLQNRGSQSELISESTEMVEGPNGAGRIETVSVVNGQLSSSPAPTAQEQQNRIASSHPDGETLPSTGPVTQGEILRQEQEAGIVLSNPHSIQPNRTTIGEMEGGATILDTVEGEEELPHARGPEIIGMEDTGPQRSAGGLDFEGAIGRPSMRQSSKSPGVVDSNNKDEEMKDSGTAEAEEIDKDEAAGADAELVKENEDAEMKTDD
ncbi:hypothetical protein K491DRAFT_710289 [Lophiostoma macrostomum CBS 122681]|uniref:PPP4R2-domain-containing protein n=1 Tax=Lophiostoma macrostomum CBS 122681 TaxID=1314788 RepID=A0A6A6TP60_9PLEO|nr:hypothetical protein K491DRAFT_710289 [Lophiostoma macrostomum CBS 122681]